MPKEKPKKNDFVIIIDSRESIPYTFASIKPKPQIVSRGLKTGDYSILGYEESGITIERKGGGLSDLFLSVGNNRKRFQKEFIRMKDFSYAALVIESNLDDIFLNPPEFSSMSRRAVFRTLLSWSIRYGVHVWACPDRGFSEKLTFLLLKRWYELKMMEI